jgi:hypothetical protein
MACIVCGDGVFFPGSSVLKFNKSYCSRLCQTYSVPFANREPPNQAPQTPAEIRDRAEKWLSWMSKTSEQMEDCMRGAWENERQTRLEWVKQKNQGSDIPWQSTLPFPINLFPEPRSDWAKKQFDRLNPTCRRGYIHSEAVDGNFQDCELVHPTALENGEVEFHMSIEKDTLKSQKTWIANSNVINQMY